MAEHCFQNRIGKQFVHISGEQTTVVIVELEAVWELTAFFIQDARPFQHGTNHQIPKTHSKIGIIHDEENQIFRTIDRRRKSDRTPLEAVSWRLNTERDEPVFFGIPVCRQDKAPEVFQSLLDTVKQLLKFSFAVGGLLKPIGFVMPNIIGLKNIVQLLDRRIGQFRIRDAFRQQAPADNLFRFVVVSPTHFSTPYGIMEQPVPSGGSFGNIKFGKNTFPTHQNSKRHLRNVRAKWIGHRLLLIGPEAFEVHRCQSAVSTCPSD